MPDSPSTQFTRWIKCRVCSAETIYRNRTFSCYYLISYCFMYVDIFLKQVYIKFCIVYILQCKIVHFWTIIEHVLFSHISQYLLINLQINLFYVQLLMNWKSRIRMFSYYYLISYCITYVVNFLKWVYIRLGSVSILLHGIVYFVILHSQHSSSDTAFLNAHLEQWQQVPINRANKWAAALFLDNIIKDFWDQCTKDTKCKNY